MIRRLKLQAFNRVVGLTLLTLMVLALAASPSAVSGPQVLSVPGSAAEAPLTGDSLFSHEGE